MLVREYDKAPIYVEEVVLYAFAIVLSTEQARTTYTSRYPYKSLGCTLAYEQAAKREIIST